MKRYLLIALGFAALACTAQAQTAPPVPLPTISVSGSAEVKVVPDEIYLRVGVETRHESLDAASEQNSRAVTRALAFLKSGGLNDKDVQTDFMSIEPNYERDVSRSKPVYYAVRKSIQVKLTEMRNFESILSGLLTNGVTTVHGIEFRTSQLRKHRDAARAQAARAAREKADALAAELGVRRGRVYSINANDFGGWTSLASSYWGSRGSMMVQNFVQDGGGSAESGEGALSLGQISVSATVNVSFLID